MASNSLLVIHIECGNRKILQKKATELEFFLTEKGIKYLAASKFPLGSVTHDEHSEVSSWMRNNLQTIFPKAHHYHDRWHKEKSLEQRFLSPSLPFPLLR